MTQRRALIEPSIPPSMRRQCELLAVNRSSPSAVTRARPEREPIHRLPWASADIAVGASTPWAGPQRTAG